ncbi:MAG TPA: crossover junction endodeoxyribonuclease RuvC [Steroidobacteraceae bacterium]|nr:crossover junction endodeoxyribonuclease RuvC [Steroidobacteraceae bacterium]
MSSWRQFDPGATPLQAPLSTAARVRVLGLDPGSRRTGFGVVDCDGNAHTHVAHGCIAAQGEALATRLREIFEGVEQLIATYRPDEIAVERVFVNRNVDSAMKLGQARGAALCAVPAGTSVFEYAPRAIKLAVVGSGAAEKAQVAHMMKVLLQLAMVPGPDAGDALAVALCHANSRRLQLLVTA